MDIDNDRFESVGKLYDRIVGSLPGERVFDGRNITENCVVAGLDIERYHRDVSLFDGWSISSSGLRQLLRRPAEYWWSSPYNKAAEPPVTNQALELGKAAHMLLLGEHGFSERYVLRPETYPGAKGEDKPWSGNANYCREWLKEQAALGRSVITETELSHIRKISIALQSKEAVRLGILNGRIERSIFMRDGDIWLKARPDVIPSSSGDFVDLKTAASVDDESLSRSIYANGYFVQAGLLRWIVREVLGADAFTSFTFVFVEKSPPYDVRVMQLKDSDIDRGEQLARKGVALLRECIRRNDFPGFDGFDQHIAFCELPGWAKTRIDIELQQKAA